MFEKSSNFFLHLSTKCERTVNLFDVINVVNAVCHKTIPKSLEDKSNCTLFIFLAVLRKNIQFQISWRVFSN